MSSDPASSSLRTGVEALGVLTRDGQAVDPAAPLHLAIGMFDGVHLGHQAVIRQAMQAAAEPGHKCGVFTFDPHPSHVLQPGKATAMLMPLSQRVHQMLALGVDGVFVQPFTLGYSRRSAEDFAAGLKELFPSLRSLHVGENFRFGAGRSGDVATLERTAGALGIEVRALPREHIGGETISSSRIREALAGGETGRVAAMLGHPYLIEGRVIPGKGLGRRITYPTLNIFWNPEARPRFGVYRVGLRQAGRKVFNGVANYGLRPTVGEASEPLLEVHLLDAETIPAPGDEVLVALFDFIRPEMSFPSIEALREQIEKDVTAVREMGDLGEISLPAVF